MSTITRGHRPWRVSVFAGTWMAYAGLYLCRKNYSVAMNPLGEIGYDNFQLSHILTGYLAMYALGQFLSGFLNDMKGARLIVGGGLVLSAAVNFIFGFAASMLLFSFLLGINGFAQSTGWSGNVKCLSSWFTIKERGRVMGWWGTCFVIGSMVATIYSQFLYDRYEAHLMRAGGPETLAIQAVREAGLRVEMPGEQAGTDAIALVRNSWMEQGLLSNNDLSAGDEELTGVMRKALLDGGVPAGHADDLLGDGVESAARLAVNAAVPKEITAKAWKILFWGPSLTLLAVALFFVLAVRNTPSDVGLNEIDEFEGFKGFEGEAKSEPEAEAGAEAASPVLDERAEIRAAMKEVLLCRTVWIYGAVYFCVKFVRYGMLFWLPVYAHQSLGYNISSSAYTSIGFEIVSPLGVLFAGYVSDKVFGARRTPVCALMLGALTLSCLYMSKGAYMGMGYYFLGLCAIGFTLYGPDALMTGPAAQDFGGKRAAGLCAGLISGIGSIGAVVQSPLIGWATKTYPETAWSWLFYVFAFFSLVSTLLISITWNDVPKARHRGPGAAVNS